MRKSIIKIAAVAAFATSATSAQAGEYINPIVGSSTSFGNDSVTCAGDVPCYFTNILSFVSPAGFQLVGGTISTQLTGGSSATNIDFDTVDLNGTVFHLTPTGNFEFGSLMDTLIIAGANNLLTVKGWSGGNASYGGQLSFAAVPETSTWAMMIVGLGMIGAFLRRRKPAPKVSYVTA